MGMFDTVYMNCPECDETIEFQSKSGECMLRTYSQNSVPPDVFRGIVGDTEWCEACGHVLTIEKHGGVPVVGEPVLAVVLNHTFGGVYVVCHHDGDDWVFRDDSGQVIRWKYCKELV
jgi:hypothetical protein